MKKQTSIITNKRMLFHFTVCSNVEIAYFLISRYSTIGENVNSVRKYVCVQSPLQAKKIFCRFFLCQSIF